MQNNIIYQYYHITLGKRALPIDFFQYYRLLFMLGLSKVDPSTRRFSEIFSSAANGSQIPNGLDNNAQKKVSAWPILTFLGLIFATPYLIMKLIGQVSTTALEECKKAVRLLFQWVVVVSNQYSFFCLQM